MPLLYKLRSTVQSPQYSHNRHCPFIYRADAPVWLHKVTMPQRIQADPVGEIPAAWRRGSQWDAPPRLAVEQRSRADR